MDLVHSQTVFFLWRKGSNKCSAILIRDDACIAAAALWIFMSALGIKILLANSSTRWCGNLQGSHTMGDGTDCPKISAPHPFMTNYWLIPLSARSISLDRTFKIRYVDKEKGKKDKNFMYTWIKLKGTRSHYKCTMYIQNSLAQIIVKKKLPGNLSS
jgi:hypothetical protein